MARDREKKGLLTRETNARDSVLKGGLAVWKREESLKWDCPGSFRQRLGGSKTQQPHATRYTLQYNLGALEMQGSGGSPSNTKPTRKA